MSTRSSISKVNPDGSITAIYCHWDGYPSYNGKILLEHYNDEQKVDELLALGDLSALGERTKPTKGVKHTFEKSEPGVCVAYGRDRGETETEARHSANKQEFVDKWSDSWCEYFYQWRSGQWFYGRDADMIESPLTKDVVGRD